MTKSFVTVEQNQCTICGENFDTGAILLDKRMQPKFNKTTITGNGLCVTHSNLHKNGFVALIGTDPTKSNVSNGCINYEDAWRTGRVVLFRRVPAKKMFNISPESLDKPFVFVDDEVLDLLHKLVPAEHK